MGAWLTRVWNDEEAFKVVVRNTVKFFITNAGFFAPLFINSKWAYYLGPVFASAGIAIPSRPAAPKP